MTDATRQALEQVAQILHDAGWDQPTTSADPSITPIELDRLRHAFESLLRHDHFEMLTATLEKGFSVEQAGEKMGLTAEEARRLFQEALRRLREFVDIYGTNGDGMNEPVRVAHNTGSQLT